MSDCLLDEEFKSGQVRGGWVTGCRACACVQARVIAQRHAHARDHAHGSAAWFCCAPACAPAGEPVCTRALSLSFHTSAVLWRREASGQGARAGTRERAAERAVRFARCHTGHPLYRSRGRGRALIVPPHGGGEGVSANAQGPGRLGLHRRQIPHWQEPPREPHAPRHQGGRCALSVRACCVPRLCRAIAAPLPTMSACRAREACVTGSVR